MQTPPSITVPARYSSITPWSGAPAGVIALNDGVNLNFSGSTQGNQSAAFTVAGWVRASASFVGSLASQGDNFYAIFTNSQFSLGWSGNGELVAGFGTAPDPDAEACVHSSLIAADGGWHFVAVSFAPDSSGSGGTLGLMVDGDWLDPATVSAADLGTNAAGDLTLCPAASLSGDQVVDVSAWMMWSAAFDEDSFPSPLWGEPAADDPLAVGLAVALNFANGSGINDSAIGATLTVGVQNWNAPCIELSNFVSLSGDDTVNPGGASGSFSAAGWMGLSEQSGGSNFYLLYNDLANTQEGDGTAHNQLMVGFQYANPSAYVFVQFNDGANPNNGFLFSTPSFDAAPWSHVAVTYEATTSSLQVYINGSLLSSFTVPSTLGFASGASSYGVSMGPSSSDDYYLQGVSYWSKALSDDEILHINNRVDPTGTPGLVAYFSFMSPSPSGLINSADGQGHELSIMDGATAVLLEAKSPTASGDNAQAAWAGAAGLFAAGRVPESDAGPMLMRRRDYQALAKDLGIDPKAPPEPADAEGAQDVQAWVDGYESMLAGVKPRLARVLRARFRRNLLVGRALKAKAPGVGRFAMTSVSGQMVMTYGTRSGPVPVPGMGGLAGDIDGTRVLELCLNVGCDVVGILLDLIGLRVPAKAMLRAFKKLGSSGLDKLGKAVAAAANANKADKTKSALNAILKLLGTLQGGGDFGLFCWNLLYELSWWDIVLAAASLITTFLGILATAGVGLVVKLASLVANILALLDDVVTLITYLASGGSTAAQAPGTQSRLAAA